MIVLNTKIFPPPFLLVFLPSSSFITYPSPVFPAPGNSGWTHSSLCPECGGQGSPGTPYSSKSSVSLARLLGLRSLLPFVCKPMEVEVYSGESWGMSLKLSALICTMWLGDSSRIMSIRSSSPAPLSTGEEIRTGVGWLIQLARAGSDISYRGVSNLRTSTFPHKPRTVLIPTAAGNSLHPTG